MFAKRNRDIPDSWHVAAHGADKVATAVEPWTASSIEIGVVSSVVVALGEEGVGASKKLAIDSEELNNGRKNLPFFIIRKGPHHPMHNRHLFSRYVIHHHLADLGPRAAIPQQ